MHSRRKYQKHCFNDIENIELDFKNETLKDGLRQYEVLKPAISQLKESGITHLVNISDIMKDNGLSVTNMKKLILLLNKPLNINLPMREIGKFNTSYRNIIFNLFFLKYGDEALQIIKDFISKEQISTDELLIYLLNKKIQEMKSEQNQSQQIENANCQYNEIQASNEIEIGIEAAAEPVSLSDIDFDPKKDENDPPDLYFFDEINTNQTNFDF